MYHWWYRGVFYHINMPRNMYHQKQWSLMVLYFVVWQDPLTVDRTETPGVSDGM